MKRLDTFHNHTCKAEKLTDSKTQVRFKICNEFFIINKATGVSLISHESFQKSNPISLKEFLENYSHLRGVEKASKIFFLEKNNDNTYQKYHVKWSKDFIDYEPSKKEFEKF